MKKTIRRIIVTLLVMLLAVSSAGASGYKLSEKMDRQLQIGSGLKGSFVIHGNMTKEDSLALFALENAEYEIRGIRSEGNHHYYVYQNGDNETMDALTEIRSAGDDWFFRSDLLEGKVWQLPTEDEFFGLVFHTTGENPSAFPALIRMMTGTEGENLTASTDKLSKMAEMWISGFSAETAFETSDDAAPRLSMTFHIPIDTIPKYIAETVTALSQDAAVMETLRGAMSEEQLMIYANGGLSAFYQEALSKLNLEGEVEFHKTVSTMGEPVSSRLSLPLDEGLTGFRTLVIGNDEKNTRFTLTGEKGTYLLEYPNGMDPAETEYTQEIRLVRAGAKGADGKELKNLALKIVLTKTHTEYEDPEGPRTHETDQYTMTAERDVSVLPEGVTEEMIPECDETKITAELHYSSKLELSSPTTLEFSLVMEQGGKQIDAAGQVKTASPWTFSAFETENAARLTQLSEEERIKLFEQFTEAAGKTLRRVPQEIQLATDGE